MDPFDFFLEWKMKQIDLPRICLNDEEKVILQP